MSDGSRGLSKADFIVGDDLDSAALVASAFPLIGGPLSNIFNGIAGARRRERFIEVLIGLNNRLKDLESEAAEDYVRTEEFEDLLQETMDRVSRERSEEKRRIYRDFLFGAIQSPGEIYNEQLRFLRTLEELQPDHLIVLRAYMQSPDPNPSDMGSIRGTLHKRVPTMGQDRLGELVTQLYDMRLFVDDRLGVTMTGQGAEQLQARITQYGNRFTAFLTR